MSETGHNDLHYWYHYSSKQVFEIYNSPHWYILQMSIPQKLQGPLSDLYPIYPIHYQVIGLIPG